MTGTSSLTLYIGTYTLRNPSVNGRADGIYRYQLDPLSGALTFAEVIDGSGTVNPSWLTLAPDRRHLYAVNEITGAEGTTGTVSAFAIDPATGHLRYLNQQATLGLAPCYVSVAPAGNACLVANYETGNLCVVPIEADGSLGAPAQVIQFAGSGPNRARQAGSHAHMVLQQPDGRHIYAIDLGSDRIMHYRFDTAHGELIPANPPWMVLPPGTGPRHIAFHPHAPVAYIISELQSTITVCRHDPASGALAALQTLSTLPPGFVGQNLGAEIQVAPSGRFVYASNRGHNSLATFAVDPATDELTLLGHVPTQGSGPRAFIILPAGDMLLVANQETDTVVAMRIDPKTGALSATGQVAAVPSPVCLQLLM